MKYNIINALSYFNYNTFLKKYKKIFFFHTPQGAGNSIDLYLKCNFGFRFKKIELMPNSYLTNEGKENINDKIYEKFFILSGHFGVNFDKEFGSENIFRIFNIRNPKKRILSNYYRNKKLYEAENKKEFVSLEKFLKTRIETGSKCFYINFLSGYKNYRNLNILGDQKNSKIDIAINNLNKINFIFIVDESKKSFKRLNEDLKLKFNFSRFIKLHKNKVSNSNFPTLSNMEKDLLEDLTKKDFELYNYIVNKYNQ